MNNGSKDWILLKNLKFINPIKWAEYVSGNRIAEEPALKW